MKNTRLLLTGSLILLLSWITSIRTMEDKKIVPKGKLNFALLKASSNGEINKVKELLANNADINALDSLGQTSLIVSAQNGHEAVVEYLIMAGAKLDVGIRKNNTTALRWAMAKNHSKIVEMLRKAGAKEKK